LQLVAYGAQDIYLTGNPQVTFFKVIYRRHTNFAIESIEQSFNGEADFGKTLNVTIARNGDLLGPITLETDVGIKLSQVYTDGDMVGDMKYSTMSADNHGWLLCDGRLLDKRQYKRLFAKIGNSFGYSSTNANLFRIPDARSKVLGATSVHTDSATGTSTITLLADSNASNNRFTLQSNSIYNFPTGTRVRLDSGESYPNPLTNGEYYYIIKVSLNQFMLAISTEYANLGTAIDITQNVTSIQFVFDLTERQMGEITGEETHKLVGREMPRHRHQLNDPGHIHGSRFPGGQSNSTGGLNSSADTVAEDNIASSYFVDTSMNYTGITMDLSGNDVPHNNIQPTIFAGSLFIYAGISTSVAIADRKLKDHYIRWGHQLIDFAEIEIGGQIIDKQYGEWMDIWTQVSYTREKYEQLLTMINCSIVKESDSEDYDAIAKLYIPLQFWFCRNPGLYLPLIALQYHEVKINVKLNSKETVNTACPLTSNVVSIDSFNYTNGSYTLTNFIEKIVNLKVYGEYVYLDTDERRRFAQVSHEYLIEQVQSGGIISNNSENLDIPLYFNHPCKCIVWRAQRNDQIYSDNIESYAYDEQYLLGQLYDFGTIGGNSSIENAEYRFSNDTVKTATLKLNSQDRFKEREGSYFRTVQPSYGTSQGAGAISLYQNGLKRYGGGFYVYNFGLEVDKHQPSGTVNFSRIDNSVLYLRMNPYATTYNYVKYYNYSVRAYAVNYNVLRIMSGMGGLAYSN